MKQPKNPFHPGEILLEEFLEPMKMSQAAFAEKVGWTKAKLNELINQFILMQDKFRLKAELYETEKQEKEAKRLKKEQEKNVPIQDKKQQLQSILDARLNYSTSNLD